MLRTFRYAAGLAALLSPLALPAQDAALPPAKELVARHIEAIGGRDAVMKIQVVRVTGKFDMAAAGLSGELSSVQSSDGRSAMRITVPGMGELAGGYDGSVGWSLNPMQGPRLLDGKELTQMQEEAGIRAAMLRESPGITGMETVEKSSIGGVECYKVKVTYASGRMIHDCYGIETGLLAGQVSVQESAMGSMELTNVMSDWKDFGGLKFATTLRQQAMGQEQVMTITAVEFDKDAGAALFELPAAVKALVGKGATP